MEAHAKPIPLQGDLAQLPEGLAFLKSLPNWVLWRWEPSNKGKWTKVPYCPQRPGQKARNNDSTTWSSYEEALAGFESGQCDGIGFNLSGTNIAAFDIDKCRDPASGKIAPEAIAIVDSSTSYTEITVSGTGLRVIGYGYGAEVHRKHKLPGSPVEVESYRGAKRYIVITGNPLLGAWPQMANITAEMDTLVATLDKQRASGDQFLPRELVELIERVPAPHEDHSGLFHHAVCWLHEWGWSADRIETYIAGKPIVPERYNDRLAGEVARSILRAKPRSEARSEAPHAEQASSQKARSEKTHSDEFGSAAPPPIELLWHGKPHNRPPRKYLVEGLLPDSGVGLISGQWGSAKTFVGVDLSVAITTGTPFAGRSVIRRGGVLFIAAEGATEIEPRLEAVVEHKLKPLLADDSPPATCDALPFAWIEESPNLQDEAAFGRLKTAVLAAEENIRREFDLPLVLILADTMNAIANFKDGNDSAEAQRVMNRLSELSKATISRPLVLAVDHFGKAVETGTRGASAKEASADVVLALLANKATNGTISNTRLAIRKLRAGRSGAEIPFNLNQVPAGFAETTCIIDWKAEHAPQPAATHARDRWTKSLRVFKSALQTALLDHGAIMRPYGSEGSAVRAVNIEHARAEFRKSYPGDNPEAKKKAFQRSLGSALSSGLIASREVNGVDHLWFAITEDETFTHGDKRDTP